MLKGLFIRQFHRHKLSSNVKTAGKGKTTLTKRQKLSIPRPKTVKPTTLDMGKFAKLSGVPVEERSTHRNLLEKVSNFSELRINQQVRACIEADPEIKAPTAIQKVAIKSISAETQEKKTWLLAAETGSGKTLAYLAPILSDLAQANPPPGPRLAAIVLVPTAELIAQVGKSLARFAPSKLRTCAVVSPSNQQLAKQIVGGLDLLVTTPDKLLNLKKNQTALCERVLPLVQYLVADEADSLLNESFSKSTIAVVASCEELKHLIFCTATIPNHFEKLLRKEYPETNRLVTPNIHRLPRHIDFKVIEVWRPPYHDRKELALQQAIYSIYNDNSEPGRTKRVVVFVNKTQQVAPLVDMLKKNGYDALGIDGRMKPEERSDVLSDFVEPAKQADADSSTVKVLIGTDLIARGIDMHKVRNIILYDQPWSAADLLHRAGRTGRLNSKGRVLLFVGRKDGKGWVKGLEKVVKQGLALA